MSCKHAQFTVKGIVCGIGEFQGKSISEGVCLNLCPKYDGPRDDSAQVAVKSQGLGDTLTKITTAVGIRPCGGCKRRADWLNKAFPYGQQDVQNV